MVNHMSSDTIDTTGSGLPALEAIKHPPMHEVVYDRIREALAAGEMMPGQRLVIRDMARMLGTSVMPVREALRRLEAENAIEVTGGGRTLAVPLLTADEYEELGLIRMELEGRAAYEAAQRITKEEIDLIASYLRAGDQASERDDRKGMAVSNRLFHQTVNRASGRPLLFRLIESLWLRAGPQVTMAITRKMVVPNWGSGLFHPHRQAFDALRTGDAAMAAAAISYDINSSSKAIASYLRKCEAKAKAEAEARKPVRGKAAGGNGEGSEGEAAG
jgi:DNA-binding GntR family transcriptional regulator